MARASSIVLLAGSLLLLGLPAHGEEKPGTESKPPADAAAGAPAPAAAQPEPWAAPEPPAENRPAYFAHLLQVIPGALEKATCHCCAKSLARCFLDMPDPTVKGKCPFG